MQYATQRSIEAAASQFIAGIKNPTKNWDEASVDGLATASHLRYISTAVRAARHVDPLLTQDEKRRVITLVTITPIVQIPTRQTW